MKIIIFAGGTGKRFWPASRRNNPKQFQEVIDGKPLIKLKYEYLRLGFKPEDIFISTGIEYKKEVEEILNELPKENFIYEPVMRDTGPAVLYATKYIYEKFGDVVISLQWADHFIKNPIKFVKVLKAGEEIAKQTHNTIIVGVPIRFPSPHRGHIQNGEIIKTIDDEFKLADFIKFVEKPKIEIAKEYIKSGDYTWNPGYFITYPSLIFEKYKITVPDTYKLINEISNITNIEEIKEKYILTEKKSFDYMFAEYLTPSEAKVLIADFGWSDVGEWISLKEALQKNEKSNVTKGNIVDLHSENCLIYNYEDSKIISTIGLKDVIIVNTKDVVAVFPKDKNMELKEYLNLLEENGLNRYL